MNRDEEFFDVGRQSHKTKIVRGIQIVFSLIVDYADIADLTTSEAADLRSSIL